MRAPAWIVSTIALAACVAPAVAGLHPGPDVSDLPPGITLVGHASVPDPLGRVTYVIRDRFLGTPLVGLPVTLDFSGCAGVRLFSEPIIPSVALTCPQGYATAMTDLEGRASFVVVGAGAADAMGPAGSCVAVHVAGHYFPRLSVSLLDLDGTGGVDGLDASILAGDLFSNQYRARSDHDFDGDVDGIDLGFFARALFAGGSASSGTTACGP